jgi:serine/threonine protein kinase/tetratricopeptide (TPR) repeat protein
MTIGGDDPQIGRRLDGRFELVRRLGQGAMGSVYLARQLQLDRPVAVKILRPDLPVDARARRRLHREARLIGRISHPNVVQVHDYGQTSGGAPYLVMEYVRGETPDRVLPQRSGLAPILAAVDGVLAGLGAAHARGVLHRDLKPANMVLRGGDPGAVVLLDFGIAAVLGADDPRWSVPAVPEPADERLTREGTVLGTPLYMAPEQARGLPATERSDLYSVGVILYEWLSGRPPFRGPVRQVMRSHVFDPPPPLTARAGVALPPALASVVLQVLAKEPEERYGSAAELRDAIRRAAAAGPVEPEPTVELPPESLPDLGRSSAPPHTLPPSAIGALEPPTADRLAGVPPFVGREDALEQLCAALQRTREGAGCLVAIEGPDGIGKTRLVGRIFEEGPRPGPLRLGRAAAVAGIAPPMQLLRAAFEDLIRSRRLSPGGLLDRLAELLPPGAEGLSPTERGRLATWLRGGRRTAEQAPPVASDEREAWQEQALVERALRTIAARTPVVLWLDDVHHCDPATAAFLARLALAATIEPFRLLVVLTRDPSIAPDPVASLLRYEGRSLRRIELRPLSITRIEELLRGLLPLGGATATRLASRSGGSPLYAVQLLRHLVDGELLTRGDDGWTLSDDLRPGGLVPSSLEQMLAARLDAALARDGGARTGAVLEAAAVLGVDFDVAALERVLGAEGTTLESDELDDLLDRLVLARLFEEPGGEGDRLRWSHVLLRDLTLARIGRSRRRRRVCRAAAASLLQGADGAELARPVVELLALAGDRDGAALHAADAGEQALASGELAEAIRYFEMARRRGPEAVRLRALWGLGNASNALGQTAAAASSYAAILELEPGPREQGWAWFGVGRCRYIRGEHRSALEALERSLELFGELEGSESSVARSRVLRTIAAVASELPDVPVPDPDAGALLAGATEPSERCEHRTTLGYLALRRGDREAAVRHFEAALEAARPGGQQPLLPAILCDLGRACREAGDRAAAARYLTEGLALARRSGQHQVEADLHNELGELSRAEGELEAASRHYRSAVQLWRHLGSRHALVGSLNLALVAVEAGRPDEAVAALDELDVGAVAAPYRAALLLTRALALGAGGRFDEAGAALDEGFTVQEALPPPYDEAVAVLARLAGSCGAAAPWLAERANDLAGRLKNRADPAD